MAERIEVQVPDGYPPMCEPVKPENRAENLVIVAASDKYLAAMAESFEKSYPKAIFDMITKPSEKTYTADTVKRLSATLGAPNVTMLVVTTLGNESQFMGCAAFLKAVLTPSNEHPMHIFRPSAFHRGHNFKKLMSWTDREVDEMHKGMNTELLETILEHQQRQREKLMGSQPYVMLGPIWVPNEYRSRGVSSKLISKGFDMARDSRVPLLLSGVFPNAKPAYLHLGFEPLEGYDDLMIWFPQTIARGKVQDGRLVY
ncbi:hypothetical protein L207DRAFT_605250 [Hyaloscypha variabilis F]|uniref:N-acetyltransferase domain-containing protein n=1 Tax=Hyaloscypha variabilis (strain UAMH 11265 / GT02V1 / F) TaxID=1149755 RepID=A0A2J6R4X0_HYAVF|nr:hypothetical protein L207DRAFT_605250 [Hyaloscypha variabilis F]